MKFGDFVRMGSVVDIVEEEEEEEEEEERVLDVEETIFVAVGKDVKQNETTLFWAVQNFIGKKICVLHIHQSSSKLALPDENLPANKMKQQTVKESQELERQKLRDVLNEYLLLLAQSGVQANEVWIEMDNVERGIVEVIAQHDVRWLVMGAAADEYYTERLAELKSKKAAFVRQQAALSCHIWFVCKGHLIYTRGDRKQRSEAEIAPPLLLMNSATGMEQSEHFRSDSIHWLTSLDMGEDANELEEMSRRLSSDCLVHSSWSSTSTMVDTSKLMTLLSAEQWRLSEQVVCESYLGVKQDTEDTKSSKWKEFEEAVKQWKEREKIMEAVCKAKALESLCGREMIQRKKMDLARVKEEVEMMKDEHDKFMKELQVIEKEKLVLKTQIAESQSAVKELEEKIISAVELLISFKERRDRLRIERENAVQNVEHLRRFIRGETASFDRSEFPVFSFMEINEATNAFDPSWKISEGRYGSIYKGILCHMHVAIKMLPSYGSKSQFDFQRELQIISRVRHPNLLTLVGSCPESRSLVYEYLKNGSLEDHLVCKHNTTLPWQIRTCIATDICSAMIFLHSNKPCIVHGNLKPSKILLDANFVSKVGDLGVVSLIQKNEDLAYSTTISNDTDETSVYLDPEYLQTGKLTPESDIYSFGVILLQLLTARPLRGLEKDVKCALENGDINAVLDSSAGDWPLEQAELLAHLALRCCNKDPVNRPDLVSELCNVLEPMRTSCISSEPCVVSKKLQRTPSHFVCPILQEVMMDPHIAADGFTYEAEAIRGWLTSGHDTSPMTNLKLEHCNLVPNYALYYAIQEWKLQ